MTAGTDKAALKTQLCAALGVPEEDVDALDRAMLGPEKREVERLYREVYLPSMVDAALKRMNESLPDGVSVFYDPTEIKGGKP